MLHSRRSSLKNKNFSIPFYFNLASCAYYTVVSILANNFLVEIWSTFYKNATMRKTAKLECQLNILMPYVKEF